MSKVYQLVDNNLEGDTYESKVIAEAESINALERYYRMAVAEQGSENINCTIYIPEEQMLIDAKPPYTLVNFRSVEQEQERIANGTQDQW